MAAPKKAVNFGKAAQSPLGSPGVGRGQGPKPAQSPGPSFSISRKVEVVEELPPLQPAIFIPTGSPMLLIEQSPYHEFLRDLGMKYNFPERLPKCIVCVSARWVSDTDSVKIMSSPYPNTVHDFFGFADCLYGVEYAAKCPTEHSAKVAEALQAGGIPWEFDGLRGYDFGCWSPLALMFPDAEVPVVQVSLAKNKDSIYHVKLGKALGELRDEGYLLLCTGAVTLGLIDLSFGESMPPPAAVAFDQWVYEVLLYEENKKIYETVEDAWEGRNNRLTLWNLPLEGVHLAAKQCHPTGDHFLPLIVASASGGPSKQIHQSWLYGALSMRSWIFGEVPPRKSKSGEVIESTPTSSPARRSGEASPHVEKKAGAEDEEELDEIEFGILKSNTMANQDSTLPADASAGFRRTASTGSVAVDRELSQVMLALEGASRSHSADPEQQAEDALDEVPQADEVSRILDMDDAQEPSSEGVGIKTFESSQAARKRGDDGGLGEDAAGDADERQFVADMSLETSAAEGGAGEQEIFAPASPLPAVAEEDESGGEGDLSRETDKEGRGAGWKEVHVKTDAAAADKRGGLEDGVGGEGVLMCTVCVCVCVCVCV